MTTSAPRAVTHLSVAERAARGKAARAEVPRSSHARFEPSPIRPDPIDLLERQAKTPELVPIRYGRMLVSPFAFYRGAALIMADDLAATPRSGLTVQCCGDAASVLEPFLAPSEFENHGERVVTGQRLMQATGDIFLGWLRNEAGFDGQARDFYVRQLRDWKGSAEIEQMVPKGMATCGRLRGWTVARGHARSGDRIAIASYLGGGDVFDRAILDFSKAYAEHNERDYNRLVEAVDSGRVAAHTGL